MFDTCSRTPSSHIIKLPEGCTERRTGKNALDVGQCSGEPCSQSSSLSQTCTGKEDCCCGPRGKEYQDRVFITCGGSHSEMIFYRIKECTCSVCVNRETVIKGERLLISVSITVFDCLNYELPFIHISSRKLRENYFLTNQLAKKIIISSY